MGRYFNRIQFLLKRISFSNAMRQFFRGFLSTEELLPLTLQEICRTCPMDSSRESRDNLAPGVATAAPAVILVYFVLGGFFWLKRCQGHRYKLGAGSKGIHNRNRTLQYD